MQYFTKLRVLLIFAIIFSAVIIGQKKPNMPPEQQAMLKEFAQLNSKLQKIQDEAMQDPQIVKDGENLKKKIAEKMIENDPSIKEVLERRDKIIAQSKPAQEKNDRDLMISLEKQYEEVINLIKPHEEAALKDPELLKEATSINESVKKKMFEIDSSAEKMISRLLELKVKLDQLKKTN